MSKILAVENLLRQQDAKRYCTTINSMSDGSVLAYCYSNYKALYENTNRDYLNAHHVYDKVNIVLQDQRNGTILDQKIIE
jgi:hypothetical protein